MGFDVYYRGRVKVFDTYEQAFNYAKSVTQYEYEYDTAYIVGKENLLDDYRIIAVIWLSDICFIQRVLM